MKKSLYVILPVLLAVALRLYPYLLSGLPFSTDAWAPIKNAELLAEYTPVPLDDKIFDGYHNYWAANSVFGVIISEITSLSPLEAMAFFFPVIGASTILIFYALVRRLCNAEISFIAAIIFGTAFTHAFFTAGVTKETYANPIYISLILVFLHPKISRQKSTVLLFAILSATLAFSHHLTSIIALAVISSISLAYLIDSAKKSLALNKSSILLTLILIVANALYFGLFAYRGFKYTVAYSDLVSAASYLVLAFALALSLTSKPYAPTQTRTLIASLGTVAAAFLFVLLTLNISLVPSFTPTVQRHVLLYVSPYFLTLPFITFGYGYQRQIKGSIAPLFWLTTLMGLEAYAFFSNSGIGVALWIRTPNFLYPPLAILAAAGLYRLYATAKKSHLQKFIKPTIMATILVIAILNVYSLYAAVSLQDRYMGYHWLYNVEEFKAGAFAEANGNSTMAGDMKIVHLMQDYFKINVDVFQGFRYLSGNSESQPQIIFIYGQMLKNGYVLGFHGVDLPENWTEKTSRLNLIYANGVAELYASAK